MDTEARRLSLICAKCGGPYNRPCDCGSGLAVRQCALCGERAAAQAVRAERERCAQMAQEWEPPEDFSAVRGWEHEQTREGIAVALRREPPANGGPQ